MSLALRARGLGKEYRVGSQEVLSLPIYPALDPFDVRRVAEAVLEHGRRRM